MSNNSNAGSKDVWRWLKMLLHGIKYTTIKKRHFAMRSWKCELTGESGLWTAQNQPTHIVLTACMKDLMYQECPLSTKPGLQTVSTAGVWYLINEMWSTF